MALDAPFAATALRGAQRIAVIGSPGSGKSSVASALAATLDLPLHHLDRLYWRPGWDPTPPEDWRAMQARLVQEARWIIDGNYGQTLSIRLARADAVVFLDLPGAVCLWRAFSRSLRDGERPDLAEGCPEHVDAEFLRFIAQFRRRDRRDVISHRDSAPAGQAWIVPRRARDVRSLFRALSPSDLGRHRQEHPAADNGKR